MDRKLRVELSVQVHEMHKRTEFQGQVHELIMCEMQIRQHGKGVAVKPLWQPPQLIVLQLQYPQAGSML